MKHRLKNTLPSLAAISMLSLVSPLLQAATVMALQESFETDGLNDRYYAIGGGDNGGTDFFARRAQFSAGADASGGAIDGDYFWGASDIDNINTDLPNPLYPEVGARDGILLFDDIDVSNLGNLKLDIAIAQGQGTFEPDNHFQIQVRFDSEDPNNPPYGDGEWTTIGGFRSVSTNTPGRYFSGPLRLATEDDPRLTSEFQEWSWDIWGFGTSMDMRIIMNSNWRDEDYYVDNIRLTGDDAVVLMSASMTSLELTEPAASESIEVTFQSNVAAPAGGLTFDVISDDWLDTTLPMPATVTIPEGDTSLTVTLDHIADGRFTGTKVIEARFDSAAISREVLRFKVTNTTPKPDVLIMEVLSVFPGTIQSDLQGDANGDGARTYPGDLFVELVNFEDFAVDLSGWTVHDDLGPRFQYPDGTMIQPGRSIVTFGGGEPNGVFGGAEILTVGTSNGFAFNTTRAEIAGLFAPFGGEMEIIDLLFRSQILEITLALPESDPAYAETASIHRTGNTRNDGFEIHSIMNGSNGSFFSPGAQIDGTPYFTPSTVVTVSLAADTTTEGDAAVEGTINLSAAAPAGGVALMINATGNGEQVRLSKSSIVIAEGQSTAMFTLTAIDDEFLDGSFNSTVVVNGPAGSDVLGGLDTIVIEDNEVNNFEFEIAEFLIDLTGTGQDPNLDGNTEQAVADQFIEIVNRSGFPVAIGGWNIVVRVGGEFALRQSGHSFDSGTVLANDGAAVVFGEIAGAKKSDPIFAGAIVDDASNDDSNGGLFAAAGSSVYVDLVNEFGFVVSTLIIPGELTNQGMSVTLVNGQPTLHLEAAGGFNLFSPGTEPDGTPYAGNGEIAFTGLDSINSKVVGVDDTYGAIYLEAYPWAYVYEADDWWYAHTVDVGVWFYSASLSTWVWTSNDIYPVVYQSGTGWVSL